MGLDNFENRGQVVLSQSNLEQFQDTSTAKIFHQVSYLANSSLYWDFGSLCSLRLTTLIRFLTLLKILNLISGGLLNVYNQAGCRGLVVKALGQGEWRQCLLVQIPTAPKRFYLLTFFFYFSLSLFLSLPTVCTFYLTQCFLAHALACFATHHSECKREESQKNPSSAIC